MTANIVSSIRSEARGSHVARDIASRPGTASVDHLYDRVARAKARWLKRVMYCAGINPTQKCLAYAISDHLNCVTLDCWPSQSRLAELLGSKCVKTVQRAANGLVGCGVLSIQHGGRSACRYAPVFLQADWANAVQSNGQERPTTVDTSVRQSFSVNPHQESCPPFRELSKYDSRQRGSWELKLVDRLGPDGLQLLQQLSAQDDRAVDRLCDALANNKLGPRELAAARLAASQCR